MHTPLYPPEDDLALRLVLLFADPKLNRISLRRPRIPRPRNRPGPFINGKGLDNLPFESSDRLARQLQDYWEYLVIEVMQHAYYGYVWPVTPLHLFPDGRMTLHGVVKNGIIPTHHLRWKPHHSPSAD